MSEIRGTVTKGSLSLDFHFCVEPIDSKTELFTNKTYVGLRNR